MERYKMDVSGGCQCGAVRYHATEMLDNPHICHCRMCQKAVGNAFAALVAAPRTVVTWTRGAPARFRSSAHVDRGFCAQCGTPLFYENLNGSGINFTIGSLDHPEQFPPKTTCGNEARMPWFESLLSLNDDGTTEAGMADEAPGIKATNRQHPDHDTATWPPEA